MVRAPLAGTRIRARRLDLGLRQAALARSCGISPSYLNLIEHNRRAIGGKLLNDLARALDVEPAALSEGAEAARVSALQAAAATLRGSSAETGRTEEFLGRFPGWADLIEAQARRISELERLVETLSDRLTHDPALSAALHDVLSTVTAIRSTSAILAGDDPVDPEWQARFKRNLLEDARRLAEASRSLARYLETDSEDEREPSLPQEEVEAWLAARGFHLEELEGPHPAGTDALLSGAPPFSDAARLLAAIHLERYAADAAELPLASLRAAIADHGSDPAALARATGAGLPTVFRRLAALPVADAPPGLGLVSCDGSGTLTFRRPADGFALPRFGAACPLWPLYQALLRPGVPIRAVIELPDTPPRRFLSFAIAELAHPGGFDGPATVEASMLILPLASPDAAAQPVGTSCRVCPRRACAARREPSILAPA